jgi:ribokinase
VVVANLEVPDEAVLAAARVARSRGAIFVLNPAPARQLTAELLANCDFVTPNILEVAALGFASVPDLQKTGVGTVVVTKGSLGADVYPSHEAAFHQEAFSVTVVDTTGAGDAFTAGLASALSTGSDLREAVRWAAATGGLATQGLGARTAYPTTDEVARALSDGTAGRQSKLPSDAS